MRIQGVNTCYVKTNSRVRNQKLSSGEPQNSPAFQGWKGGTKGAAIGAGAALTLAALAGPFGIAVLPLWTTVGAIAGHANEEENKPDKK